MQQHSTQTSRSCRQRACAAHVARRCSAEAGRRVGGRTSGDEIAVVNEGAAAELGSPPSQVAVQGSGPHIPAERREQPDRRGRAWPNVAVRRGSEPPLPSHGHHRCSAPAPVSVVAVHNGGLKHLLQVPPAGHEQKGSLARGARASVATERRHRWAHWCHGQGPLAARAPSTHSSPTWTRAQRPGAPAGKPLQEPAERPQAAAAPRGETAFGRPRRPYRSAETHLRTGGGAAPGLVQCATLAA